MAVTPTFEASIATRSKTQFTYIVSARYEPPFFSCEPRIRTSIRAVPSVVWMAGVCLCWRRSAASYLFIVAQVVHRNPYAPQSARRECASYYAPNHEF